MEKIQWKNKVNSHISNNIQTILTKCQEGTNYPLKKEMDKWYAETVGRRITPNGQSFMRTY